MTDVNGGFPRLVSRLGNSAGRVRRASSHAAIGGPRLFPSCAAVPSPPPPVSLSWWAGEESDPSRGFLGPGPPPPACSAAPRVLLARPRRRLSVPARDAGKYGVAAPGGRGGGWGGPGGFRHLAALRRFSPGSSLPVGRGRGQLSRRVKARQRGVQPGSGARAGRAFPAAAVGECGPRRAGHDPHGAQGCPGHHCCLSWRCRGRSQWMEGPACCRPDGRAQLSMRLPSEPQAALTWGPGTALSPGSRPAIMSLLSCSDPRGPGLGREENRSALRGRAAPCGEALTGPRPHRCAGGRGHACGLGRPVSLCRGDCVRRGAGGRSAEQLHGLPQAHRPPRKTSGPGPAPRGRRFQVFRARVRAHTHAHAHTVSIIYLSLCRYVTLSLL